MVEVEEGAVEEVGEAEEEEDVFCRNIVQEINSVCIPVTNYWSHKMCLLIYISKHNACFLSLTDSRGDAQKPYTYR